MDAIHFGRPWILTLAVLSVVGVSSLGCDADRDGSALTLPDPPHKAMIVKSFPSSKADVPRLEPALANSPNIVLLLLVAASGRYSVTAGRASSRYTEGPTRTPVGEMKDVKAACAINGAPKLQASAARR